MNANRKTPAYSPDNGDDETCARADRHENGRLVSRGRPRALNPKQRVTLRLDGDVVAALRASGRGWQTRVNGALKEWIGKGAA